VGKEGTSAPELGEVGKAGTSAPAIGRVSITYDTSGELGGIYICHGPWQMGSSRATQGMHFLSLELALHISISEYCKPAEISMYQQWLEH
jgi:hypothetical protein